MERHGHGRENALLLSKPRQVSNGVILFRCSTGGTWRVGVLTIRQNRPVGVWKGDAWLTNPRARISLRTGASGTLSSTLRSTALPTPIVAFTFVADTRCRWKMTPLRSPPIITWARSMASWRLFPSNRDAQASGRPSISRSLDGSLPSFRMAKRSSLIRKYQELRAGPSTAGKHCLGRFTFKVTTAASLTGILSSRRRGLNSSPGCRRFG